MQKNILALIFSTKVCILILIFLAYSLLPFGAKFYYPNFTYPTHEKISLQTAYKTWDAQHYLYISEQGYHLHEDSDAFSPLFPLLIHIATFFIRNSFVSGIVLSNIFSLIAFYLFYILIRNQYSEKIAQRSLFVLLAFPTSFYFSLIYTESLFFLLIVLFFLFLQKRKFFFASLLAFLMPLTRLIGIAIIVPFFFSYILEYAKHSLRDELSVIQKTLLQKRTLLLLLPILGLGMAMGVFYLYTGSFFTQFSAQQNFISQYSFFSIFNPLFFLKALFTYPLQVHGFTNSFLDRFFFAFFLLSLFLMRKRVSIVYFIYAICFGLIPVLSGSFMSYMRYLVIVFPLFICISRMSFEKKYESFFAPYILVSIMLQTLFLVMHSLNYWVS